MGFWTLWMMALPYVIPHLEVSGDTLWVRVVSDEPLQNLQVFVDPQDTLLRSARYLPFREDAAWEFWDRERRRDTLLRLPLDLPPGHYRYQVAVTRSNGERIHSRWYGFSWDGTRLGPGVDLGPYLFYPHPDTAVIRVRFSRAVAGVLETPEGSRPLHPVPELPLWREARIPVRPGGTLRYRVCVEGSAVCSAWYDAVTPPHPGSPVTFAALGDTRSGWYHPASTSRTNLINVPVLRLLVHQALRAGAQLLFVLGDLVHGYTEDTTSVRLQYETWLQATEPVSGVIPLFPVVGNHDATAPFVRKEGRDFAWRADAWAPERVWARFFELPANGPTDPPDGPPYRENVYWMAWGDLLLVALNSDYRYERVQGTFTARRVDARQRRWLEDVLRRYGKGRTVVVGVHEPLFPTSRHRGRSLDAWPEDRDALLEILRRYRVPLVMAGHEHLYARLRIPGDPPILHVITGRGGSPLYRDILFPLEVSYRAWVEARSADEHVVVCTLERGRTLCRVINTPGFVVDAFTLP